MPTIKITIARDGVSTVDANGFSGGNCVKSTSPIVKALMGASPAASVKKPEFYTPAHLNKELVQVNS